MVRHCFGFHTLLFMWNGGRGTWTLTGIAAQQILSLVRLPFRHTPKKEVSLLTSYTSDLTNTPSTSVVEEWNQLDSNQWPHPYQGCALPTELWFRWDNHTIEALDCQVGNPGIEPGTRRSSTYCSTNWANFPGRWECGKSIISYIVGTGLYPTLYLRSFT